MNAPGMLARAVLTILLAACAAGALAAEPARQKVRVDASSLVIGDERVVTVRLRNAGKQPATVTSITLVDAEGRPIQPATYSEDELTMSAGESRVVEIRYPAQLDPYAWVAVSGANVRTASTRVQIPEDRSMYQQPYWRTRPYGYPSSSPSPSRTAVGATPKVTPKQ